MKNQDFLGNPVRLAVLVFIAMLAGQGLWIYFFGVDAPQGDQWDGEFFWYKALVTNNASLHGLIAPHNEHRIAATRLFNGAIFFLIGGWRPIVVMYAQAFLISGLVAWLSVLLNKYAGSWRNFGLVFTLIAFLSPYSWQNTLGAFQNQFYFMLLFAFAVIGLLAWCPSWPAIVAAIVIAALSPFTTAGGLMTIVILIFMIGLNLVTRRITLPKFAIILVFILPVLAWHITNQHHVVGHDVLRARSAAEFVVSLLKILSWPEFPIGLFFWGVIALSILDSYRNRGRLLPWISEFGPVHIFILGALSWLLLQMAATAYSRTHSDLMAARYQQTYSLIIPLFFLAVNVFGTGFKWLRPWLVASLIIVGLLIRNGREWPYMMKGVAEMRFAKMEITKAVRMNNFEYLKSREKGEFSLGYFTADAIWERIHDEKLFPHHLWLEKGNR